MAWVTFDRLLQNYSISFRIENAHQSQNNLKLAVTGRSRYVTQFCRISALIILKLAALTGCYSSGSMPVDVISVLNVFYDAAFTSLQSEFAGYFVLNLPITLCPSALPTKRSILLLPSSASTLPVPNLFPQNNIKIKYINPSQTWNKPVIWMLQVQNRILFCRFHNVWSLRFMFQTVHSF